jgi:AraC family transcriptional regulator
MFRFVLGPIDAEPTIVVRQEPLFAVGPTMRTSAKTVFRDVPRLLARYLDHKKRFGIPNLKEPWAFIARGDGFDPATVSWDYTAGDAVTVQDPVPEGMVAFGMPAGTYAVFRVRPKLRFLLGWAIAATKRHAIQEWFPRSGYELAGADFEYNDADVPGSVGVDLYFSARRKGPDPSPVPDRP